MVNPADMEKTGMDGILLMVARPTFLAHLIIACFQLAQLAVIQVLAIVVTALTRNVHKFCMVSATLL